MQTNNFGMIKIKVNQIFLLGLINILIKVDKIFPVMLQRLTYCYVEIN